MRFEVDGHAIDYEVRGEGRPVLLVHGLTTDRRILIDACEPAFADQAGWRRIYVDLPGHGASTGNRACASADGLVDALAALAREAAPEGRPLVFGYAYGGYLAQGLMREMDVGGLMLVCPVVEPDFGRRTVPQRLVAVRDEGLEFGDDPREREAFEEVAVRQTRGVLEAFRRVVHPANITVDQEFVGAVRYRYAMARPFAHLMSGFDGPVAVVCGRSDHWVGWEDATRLVRAARRASYEVVPECGQLLPLEAGDALRASLRAWLARARG